MAAKSGFFARIVWWVNGFVLRKSGAKSGEIVWNRKRNERIFFHTTYSGGGR